MTLKFQQLGYNWILRAGFPPMGSREQTDPSFDTAVRSAHPRLARLTDHELASWIVARLDYLTAGSLAGEGSEFAHDTNEFGYKLKVMDDTKATLAHGAIVIHATRTYFASVDARLDGFQSIVVDLLADSPGDLSKIEIRVVEPEERRYRRYGWDGHSLLG